MMIERRVEEIANSIKNCSKDFYFKSELLPEMLGLQKELVDLTFNKSHVDKADLKLWDVVDHLTQLSEDNHGAANDALNRFRDDCKEVNNLIRAQISGSWGENKAFTSIGRITGPHILLKNVSIKRENVRTEMDGIVITSRGVFIIEVKNTKKDIFIDENGDYFRVGEYSRWDSNLGSKMNTRKLLVEEILREAGFTNISVFTIVVFTNNRIEVKNHCEQIKNCFLNQLPYNISEWETGTSIEDIDEVASVIDNMRDEGCFPLDFNAKQFKLDFATVLAELEAASSYTSKEENVVSCDTAIKETETQWPHLPWKTTAYPRLRNIGMVAVTVVAFVTTAINIRNRHQ